MSAHRDVGLYRDVGVVLRTWKLGEADRIVTIMTRNNGKIRCVAKGVRKTQSRFGSRLEATSHIQVQLYRGRGDLDTLTQVETVDRFLPLRENLELFAGASSMLEAIDNVGQDREPNEALYVMLCRALHTLTVSTSHLVVAGFFLKLLIQEGFSPAVDVCARCGETNGLGWFSVADGGTTCERCRIGMVLSVEAHALLKLALGGQLGAVLNQPSSPATREVDLIATRLLEHMLEKRLRSSTVMEQV